VHRDWKGSRSEKKSFSDNLQAPGPHARKIARERSGVPCQEPPHTPSYHTVRCLLNSCTGDLFRSLTPTVKHERGRRHTPTLDPRSIFSDEPPFKTRRIDRPRGADHSKNDEISGHLSSSRQERNGSSHSPINTPQIRDDPPELDVVRVENGGSGVWCSTKRNNILQQTPRGWVGEGSRFHLRGATKK